MSDSGNPFCQIGEAGMKLGEEFLFPAITKILELFDKHRGVRMKFIEAVELLVKGNFVIRESWDEDRGYLVFMPGMKNIWCITINPTVNAGNNLFSVEDYMAEDWILLSDRKTVEEEKLTSEDVLTEDGA